MKSSVKVVREMIIEVPELGERIKEIREYDRRSLKELAELAGMTTMNWYRIESGTQKIPEQTLRRIEEALGVDFGVQFDEPSICV